nr:hypothetical protein GCM10020093_068480 [Planobispora longispora]
MPDGRVPLFRADAGVAAEGEPLPEIRNVASSPYLIQDQPAPPVDFRLRIVESGKCVGVDGQQAVQVPCSDNGTVWRRTIDGAGYVTIRNVGNHQCLTGATAADGSKPVVTTVCAAKNPSQQWLPGAGQDKINFTNRADGKSGPGLAVPKREARDGAPVVRANGSTLKFEPLADQMFKTSPVGFPAPAPAPTPSASSTTASEPTTAPTSVPTSAPGPSSTPGPEDAPAPTKTPTRTVTLKSAYGTCLTAYRATARLGSCRTKWQLVPVAGKSVQVRFKSRCLALGPVNGAKRSVVLAKCSKTSKGQRWLLEPQRGGAVTLKSATTNATRIIRFSAKPTHIYAKATYVKKSLKFTIG